jgi:tetratricopeptide (TPR) repeat protein
LFRAVAEEKAARVRTDRARLEKDSKGAAAAYRNLGAIARFGDPKRAREAYAKALEYDSEDLEALYWYGYLNFIAGDLGIAQRTLARLLETATARGDQRGIYRAHLVQGQVMQDRGSLPSAREHIEKSLGIALAESASAKDDFEWQRDVSEAQIRTGDVLQAQGNLPAALESYKAARAIGEGLAAADPGNSEWQRNLSVFHEKIGYVLEAQGNLPAALESYKADLAIMERLAAADPGNAGWQRDLSVSHENIGDVLEAQGNLPAALESYKAAHAIMERLAAADPGNAGWQRDLSVSHARIGSVLEAQGNLPAALEGYKSAHAIRERLAAADPGNAGWQRDLSVSYNKVGDVLVAQGNLTEALKSYRESLAIRERLAKADPKNAGWQRDLSVSYYKVGMLAREAAGARRYSEALQLQEALAVKVEEVETTREGTAAKETAEALNNVAWYALFAREFTKALAAAERAHALLPDDLSIETNRAHALLFLEHGEDCKALYLAHKGKPLSEQEARLWEHVIAEDFAEFRKAGLTHPMMAEIEKEFGVPP